MAGHGANDIMFACYQCSNTFCMSCLETHRNHTLIYFKDPYIELNYSDVRPVKPESAFNGDEDQINSLIKQTEEKKSSVGRGKRSGARGPPGSSTPTFECFKAKHRYTQRDLFIKVIKEFKSRPEEFKRCIFK